MNKDHCDPAVTIEFDQYVDQLCYTAKILEEALQKCKKEDDHYIIRLATWDQLESNQRSQYPRDFSLVREGYLVSRIENHGNTEIHIIGADTTGVMYGGFDVAFQIRQERSLAGISEVVRNPHIQKRGIKFNIPLDARTPSYSDAGDAANKNIINMWDLGFWREFLDEMALNKYNTLSLWNLHPFPSLVRVPDYPDIALDDIMQTTVVVESDVQGRQMSNPHTLANLKVIKQMSIDEKIAFWNQVMTHADNRGIEVLVFTWNIFTYGTEGNNYGITCDQTNDITIDYFRKSVIALFETYPLLAGIGITAGENMAGDVDQSYADEPWLMKTYGQAICDLLERQPTRKIRFIHRAHQTAKDTINTAFSQLPIPIEYSFKYSQAHMYGSVKPSFGDSFFAGLKPGEKTWLTVRNDDFYMYRWTDPEFARSYIANMPTNDRLIGFYMGPDGYIWGREYISTEPDIPRQQVIKKMWLMFAIWGRLAYSHDLPEDTFITLVSQRFPSEDSRLLYNAWQAASKIIPLVNCLHWHNLDLQWYPEACYSRPRDRCPLGFHDIHNFVQSPTAPGSDHVSILDYVQAILDRREMQGVTPLEVIATLEQYSSQALTYCESTQPQPGKELRHTLGDIRCMGYLGQYYQQKFQAALEFAFYQKTGDQTRKKNAIANLERAAKHWRVYSIASKSMYQPQHLTRMNGVVDLEALQAHVDNDIKMIHEFFV